MIAQIEGVLIRQNENSVWLENQGMIYEVLVPQTILSRISQHVSPDKKLRLITYHYLQVEPSRSIPVLVGFLNEVEKEFFSEFITVSGIGPRAALKALSRPISQSALAIDSGDINFLKGLPGIGQQKAKEIVAKLQGKVGKFGLIQDKSQEAVTAGRKDLEEEAIQVLMQLQYKRQEAKEMVEKALAADAHAQTVEELLNLVYHQKVSPGTPHVGERGITKGRI
jgi:Holliday junction DNA helicase RuvA